jgi:hypothetical protein
MPYDITTHQEYLRGVLGRERHADEYLVFFKELQRKCAQQGFARALVVVLHWIPELPATVSDALYPFYRVDAVSAFKLALVCRTWALYEACANAQLAATRPDVHARAFFSEAEALGWLARDLVHSPILAPSVRARTLAT